MSHPDATVTPVPPRATDDDTADPLLLIPEVVTMTRLSDNTLRYLRHDGRGPRSFLVGRRVVYRRSEVLRWLAEQESTTGRGGRA